MFSQYSGNAVTWIVSHLADENVEACSSQMLHVRPKTTSNGCALLWAVRRMACCSLFAWSTVCQSLSVVSQVPLDFGNGRGHPCYFIGLLFLVCKNVWTLQPPLCCLWCLTSYIETFISYLVYNRSVILLLGNNNLPNTQRC